MELRDPPAQALRRGLAGAARVALLAGPTVIAFRAGGYFEETTQVAGIAAWIVLAILAVVVDGPIVPRTLAARLALGGIAAFALWVLLSRLTWAPLEGPAGEDVQRDALYVAVLVAGALAWRGHGTGRAASRRCSRPARRRRRLRRRWAACCPGSSSCTRRAGRAGASTSR